MQRLQFELPIYPFEIDFAGVVSNIVYVKWMEMGRTRLLEEMGLPIGDLQAGNIVPVLIRTDIRYRYPLRLTDRVRIELYLTELEGATATMRFEFYRQDGKLVAEAFQTGLFVTYSTFRPHRLSVDERTRFLPYLQETSETTAGRS